MISRRGAAEAFSSESRREAPYLNCFLLQAFSDQHAESSCGISVWRYTRRVFGRLFKQPYVIIGIRQHAFGAITDDGIAANLDGIRDIDRVIDQDHRGCGALVITDPRRRNPNLPPLWIANSFLVPGTSRHSLPKRGTKQTSDYIFRQGDAVNSYVGLSRLTECRGG